MIKKILTFLFLTLSMMAVMGYTISDDVEYLIISIYLLIPFSIFIILDEIEKLEEKINVTINTLFHILDKLGKEEYILIKPEED